MEGYQYIYPTRKAKISFWLFIGVLILIVIFIEPVINFLVPTENRSFTFMALEAEADFVLLLSFFLSAVGSLFFFMLSAVLFFLGYKIIKSKEFPPAGMPVIYKTKVRKGNFAVSQGVCCLFLGLLFVPFLCFSVYSLWLSIQFWLI